MKKVIALRLCLVIIISMLVSAFLGYYIQIKSAKESFYTNSEIRINQISQILENNDADIERLKENLKEDYFIRAKAAAYMVQNQPQVIGDLEETKKIAALLQVDELHIFDTKGKIYAGSEPKYYNYTFQSGEQMQYFLPMLDDVSLQLCQEVTPNTAEGKLMQYIAVWREDQEGIVQIGMEPVRLLEALEKNELSHIFNLVTAEKGITIFAMDPETKVILGATNDNLTGSKLEELKSKSTKVNQEREDFTTLVDGKKNYGVIRPMGNLLIGVSSTYEYLYQNIPSNMLLLIISLCILSILIIFFIMNTLDKYIIHGMHELIAGMKKISNGDLDSRVGVASTPEFVELSSSINNMVMSLLGTTNKLSLVFQNVDIPIAVYEYNQDMNRVLATNKIGDILRLSEEEVSEALSDKNSFFEIIQHMYAHPFMQEKDVYLLCKDTIHYVKLQSFQEESSTLGILVDVTEEVLEKQKIILERDIDHLTGLLSRRAFCTVMEQLFAKPEELKNAVLLMTDLDNLKYVNDSWGHEYGDKLLTKAAGLLKECKAPQKVAARLGGDEFVLVIYGADSKEEVQGYIDCLYEQIAKTTIHVLSLESIPVCLSGGYIFYPEFAGDYTEMLHLADQTMYQVKKNGKGYFEKYES